MAARVAAAVSGRPPARGITGALRVAIFRRIWAAGLISNLGLMIQSVGSAWTMTQLAASPELVALVQTALMMPQMIFSLASGAIADMYDRRVVALAGVSLSLTGAMLLALASVTGVLVPSLLLALCFVIGSGMSLMGPALQTAIREQVPREVLPAAIALGSIGYSLARSFGPAVGGAIVALMGLHATFAINVLFYLPLVVILSLWKRLRVPPRLPPEGIGRAMVSGVRYILHSPPARVPLSRAFVTATAGGAMAALMPLVSRDLLGGGPQTFGILLGVVGLGALVSGLALAWLRERFGSETLVRVSAVCSGSAYVLVGVSHSLPLTVAALFIVGSLTMMTFSLFNIEIQVSSPRWVVGRSVAAFQAAAAGGTGIGAVVWGLVAQRYGPQVALIGSGLCLIGCVAFGLWLKMPAARDASSIAEAAIPTDPEVKLALTARSGPVIVEIEYRIDPDQARLFYGTMQQMQSIRQRNGAYGWSISRDIADPALWTERFHCPTWLDYLHQRARSTQADRVIELAVWNLHSGPEPVRIRRMLERPFGSVRWKEGAPDTGGDDPLSLSTFPGVSP